MPITYHVHNDGHTIIAIASGVVTSEEFVEYEVAHATDERIKSPLSELLVIKAGALRNISEDDIEDVIRHRKEQPNPPMPHKCAMVISLGDAQSWDIAKFYEGMVKLHYPKTIIVFGDERIARIWLGIEEQDIG